MSTRGGGADALSIKELLQAEGRVLYALMLRDVRTRMAGSALGYIIVIAWPLSHILILLGMNTQFGRAAPFGDSAAVWFATGIVPFMSFSYMSRFTMMGVVLNRPLLSFPAISVTDVLFARALLEVLSASLVILILIAIFVICGVDFSPRNPQQVFYALLATFLLGLGAGVLNGVIATVAPFWLTGYALFTIVVWMSSGILFVPDALPETAQKILAYNPLLHCVEWIRSGYYDDYGAHLLNKTYLLSFGTLMLFFGLLAERLFRGRLLR